MNSKVFSRGHRDECGQQTFVSLWSHRKTGEQSRWCWAVQLLLCQLTLARTHHQTGRGMLIGTVDSLWPPFNSPLHGVFHRAAAWAASARYCTITNYLHLTKLTYIFHLCLKIPERLESPFLSHVRDTDSFAGHPTVAISSKLLC